ncbi:hypothetical protein [Nonomuraea sp. bgisy101]|uniref:hypothetical protein n=1 Tax=Nonomuraea sp. bgisy101 TaxID=3413784 RepID=UPI003D717D66
MPEDLPKRRRRLPDGKQQWPDGTDVGPLGLAAMQRIRETLERLQGSGTRQEPDEDEQGCAS